MSLVVRKSVFAVSDQVRHKPVCTQQKMARGLRGLKFRIEKVEGLYYSCSENKGADQLRGYREADLRLCFRIYVKICFSHDTAHMISLKIRSAWASIKFDQPLLWAQWVAKGLSYLHGDREDSDQTWQMPMLMRLFAVPKAQIVGFDTQVLLKFLILA